MPLGYVDLPVMCPIADRAQPVLRGTPRDTSVPNGVEDSRSALLADASPYLSLRVPHRSTG